MVALMLLGSVHCLLCWACFIDMQREIFVCFGATCWDPDWCFSTGLSQVPALPSAQVSQCISKQSTGYDSICVSKSFLRSRESRAVVGA